MQVKFVDMRLNVVIYRDVPELSPTWIIPYPVESTGFIDDSGYPGYPSPPEYLQVEFVLERDDIGNPFYMRKY